MMNRRAFHKLIKDAGKLIVGPVGDELWASDAYWLMPYAGSPAEALLSWWNLSPPGVFFEAGGRVFPAVADRSRPPAERQMPDLAKLVKRPKKVRKLTVRTVGSAPVLIDTSHVLAVIADDPDGTPVAIRRDYLDLLDPDWLHTEMVAAGHCQPVYLKGGVVMPIRISP